MESEREVEEYVPYGLTLGAEELPKEGEEVEYTHYPVNTFELKSSIKNAFEFMIFILNN